MFDLAKPKNKSAVINVVGVGGAGRNAVAHMLDTGLRGVNFFCANTDAQAMLDDYVEATNIPLGQKRTEGLGAGASPEVGRLSAEDSKDQIVETLLQGTDLLFIAAGMGGGTGTGAAPVIAQLAQEHNVLVVSVVTTPFRWENQPRISCANVGITELLKHTNSLIVIDNNKLEDANKVSLVEDAFKEADCVLSDSARCITELVTRPGKINVDFADLRTVMSTNGLAMIGMGSARGDNRAHEAVTKALSNPMIDQNNLTSATNALVNVTASKDMLMMSELNTVGDMIKKSIHNEAMIISGMAYNEDLGDELVVSVVIAGLQKQRRSGGGSPPPSFSNGGPLRSAARSYVTKADSKPMQANEAKMVQPNEGKTVVLKSTPSFLQTQAD